MPLDAIVGSVDRSRDFDRRFRPTSGRSRGRWEQIAAAARRGEALPPVDLLRVGELYFVRDGHHRVSVARALGRTDIDAYVTEVTTRVGAEQATRLSDLPFKSHERVFFERVPLPAQARSEIVLSEPFDYALLAEMVEAWGFRAIQSRGEAINRKADGAPVARDRVSPRRRDAARGGTRWRPDGRRGIHANRGRALLAAAHARVERRRPPTGHRRQRTLAPPRALNRLGPGGAQVPLAWPASMPSGPCPTDVPTKRRRRYAPRMAPEQRREQLIDAAIEVILERGYAGVSIEAIAREAGITRPVVYDHFPNLNRLLHAVIEREERIALEQLARGRA